MEFTAVLCHKWVKYMLVKDASTVSPTTARDGPIQQAGRTIRTKEDCFDPLTHFMQWMSAILRFATQFALKHVTNTPVMLHVGWLHSPVMAIRLYRVSLCYTNHVNATVSKFQWKFVSFGSFGQWNCNVCNTGTAHNVASDDKDCFFNVRQILRDCFSLKKEF